MNFNGIIIAILSFVVIGIFHPIVIKSEYYFTARCWPVFMLFGIVFLVVSLKVTNTIASAFLGVIGCTCLWSILELKEQAERVRKGWFPANPNRTQNP